MSHQSFRPLSVLTKWGTSSLFQAWYHIKTSQRLLRKFSKHHETSRNIPKHFETFRKYHKILKKQNSTNTIKYIQIPQNMIKLQSADISWHIITHKTRPSSSPRMLKHHEASLHLKSCTCKLSTSFNKWSTCLQECSLKSDGSTIVTMLCHQISSNTMGLVVRIKKNKIIEPSFHSAVDGTLQSATIRTDKNRRVSEPKQGVWHQVELKFKRTKWQTIP